MAIAGLGQGLVVSPLFGFVLAGVPAERAGVGSGIVSTTMQAALALGVASLGSLYLSLSATDSLGVRDAFITVLGVQTAVAVVVAVAAWALSAPPRLQAAPAPVSEPAFEQAA